MSKELEDAFRKLKERDVDTFPADVISVDKVKGTCTVNDGELNYTNVRLTAIIKDNGKSVFLFPKIGSSVLVSPINEDLKKLYVEVYSELESFDLKIESVQFQIDKDGFLMKKQAETLKKLINDLLSAVEIMSFTVTTPDTINGSTTILNNKAQFTAIKTRFNQFLKDN